MLQHTATHCDMMQHAATCCNPATQELDAKMASLFCIAYTFFSPLIVMRVRVSLSVSMSVSVCLCVFVCMCNLCVVVCACVCVCVCACVCVCVQVGGTGVLGCAIVATVFSPLICQLYLFGMCSSVVQHVAACCRVLQCVLQRVCDSSDSVCASHLPTLPFWFVLQRVAACCSML